MLPEHLPYYTTSVISLHKTYTVSRVISKERTMPDWVLATPPQARAEPRDQQTAARTDAASSQRRALCVVGLW